MRLLDEWHFNFMIETPKPIDGSIIGSLMIDVCVNWAEENGFYVGGGIQSVPDRHAQMSDSWIANFGFYTQQEDQLTSEQDAAVLLAVISQWCQQHAYRLTGGFEAYLPEEDEGS
jgi:hypothetical protein